MQSQANWREVIHQYFLAQEKHSLEHSMLNCDHYLDVFRTASLNQREAQSAEIRRKAKVPLRSPDTYILIEKLPTVVIAELAKQEHGKPFFDTRFRLLREGEAWFIDDEYWKCSCNDGMCFLCKQNKATPLGVCWYCGGRGFVARFWNLSKTPCVMCEGSGKCNSCKGTGRCDSCLKSDMPGWKSTSRE